jgi:hypothetical protein
VAVGADAHSSIKLVNDLTNCPSDGLVIGADAIRVDLDGSHGNAGAAQRITVACARWRPGTPPPHHGQDIR